MKAFVTEQTISVPLHIIFLVILCHFSLFKKKKKNGYLLTLRYCELVFRVICVCLEVWSNTLNSLNARLNILFCFYFLNYLHFVGVFKCHTAFNMLM